MKTFETPGVVATIQVSRERWTLKHQSTLTICRAAGRVDYWPNYKDDKKEKLSREEIGQLMGGN